MQAAPVIAGTLLVGLMTASGFKLVPESALVGSGASALSDGGSQIDFSGRAPRGELFSASVVQAEPVITAVTIKSPQDIERSTATLRGRVVVGPEELGSAFFIYATKRTNVTSLSERSNSYAEVLEKAGADIYTKRTSGSLRRTSDVSVRVGGLSAGNDYYVQLCVEVRTQLRCSALADFESLEGTTRTGSERLPTIRGDEELVSGEEAAVTVDVNMHDMQDGSVYIVYGESQEEVVKAAQEEYGDIDENGDRLQKTRVQKGVDGSRELTKSIDDLDDETQHFYVACVSYDGLRDGIVCTRVSSFTTPGDAFGDAPRVAVTNVNISKNSVTITSSVDMRSFKNGQAFFVYGTDESAIDQIEGQRAMASIRQNGDRLQRVLVDSDVDRSDSFRTVVHDLRFNTRYVVRLCVEFENEDLRGRDRLYVECGEAREFTTR